MLSNGCVLSIVERGTRNKGGRGEHERGRSDHSARSQAEPPLRHERKVRSNLGNPPRMFGYLNRRGRCSVISAVALLSVERQVLIVEDDTFMGSLLADLLKGRGFQVLQAADAVTARNMTPTP